MNLIPNFGYQCKDLFEANQQIDVCKRIYNELEHVSYKHYNLSEVFEDFRSGEYSLFDPISLQFAYREFFEKPIAPIIELSRYFKDEDKPISLYNIVDLFKCNAIDLNFRRILFNLIYDIHVRNEYHHYMTLKEELRRLM